MDLAIAHRSTRSCFTRCRTLALAAAVAALTAAGCSDDSGNGDIEGDQPGECTDGADNDRDGLYDCDDPDCAGSPACGGADGDADADAQDVPEAESDEDVSEVVEDVPEAEVEDVPAEVSSAICGNGLLEDGEECDQAEEEACVTACDTVGRRSCAACSWRLCIGRDPETCNGTDDDCDGETDECCLSGGFISFEEGEPEHPEIVITNGSINERSAHSGALGVEINTTGSFASIYTNFRDGDGYLTVGELAYASFWIKVPNPGGAFPTTLSLMVAGSIYLCWNESGWVPSGHTACANPATDSDPRWETDQWIHVEHRLSLSPHETVPYLWYRRVEVYLDGVAVLDQTDIYCDPSASYPGCGGMPGLYPYARDLRGIAAGVLTSNTIQVYYDDLCAHLEVVE